MMNIKLMHSLQKKAKETEFNMPKFTLIAEHLDNNAKTLHKVTHEFEVDHIDEVLQNFDSFLRGVSYYPQGDRLEYVYDTVYDTDYDELEDDFPSIDPQFPAAHYEHDLKED